MNSAEYNKCRLHWYSIHPVLQCALLMEIKKTIDCRIESEMENEYAHISKTDAMGTDVSDVDALFQRLSWGLNTMAVGCLWDTDIFSFKEFQFFIYFGVWSLWRLLAFILCLVYGGFFRSV